MGKEKARIKSIKFIDIAIKLIDVQAKEKRTRFLFGKKIQRANDV